MTIKWNLKAGFFFLKNVCFSFQPRFLLPRLIILGFSPKLFCLKFVLIFRANCQLDQPAGANCQLDQPARPASRASSIGQSARLHRTVATEWPRVSFLKVAAKSHRATGIFLARNLPNLLQVWFSICPHSSNQVDGLLPDVPIYRFQIFSKPKIHKLSVSNSLD